MAIEKTINIKVNTGDSEKELGKIDKGVKGVNESTSGLTGTLDKMTGGAVTKLKGMTGALGGVAGGFKSIGVAIIASGIGLLILTIAAVTAAFKSSEEGQNKFAKIMGVIGSVTGNLIDLLSDFGELVISVFENPKQAIKDFTELIKENITNRFEGLLELVPKLGQAIGLLFEGKFGAAGKVAADAVGKVALGMDSVTDAINGAGQALINFGKEVAEDAAKAAAIAESRAKADKIDRKLIVERAIANQKIAEFREIAARADLYNLEQRKNALISAGKINDNIIEKEKQSALLRRDAIVEENKLSKSNKEALDAEEQAKAKVIELETQRLQLAKRLGTELASIINQEASAAKAEADAKLKEREAEIKEFQKQSDGNEIEAVRQKEKDKTRILGEEIQARVDANKKASDDEILLAQLVSDAEIDIRNQTLNLIGQIAKKGSAVGKAVAVAQATISGIEGVQNAFTTASASPVTTVFPAYPFVQAGLAGAFSAVQIAKILSVKEGGGGGGAGVSNSGGGRSAPAFNLVQGTGSNQIAESLQSQKEPLKAYVVSSDMSSAQAVDRNIKETATI
jgi:hypothetical protein